MRRSVFLALLGVPFFVAGMTEIPLQSAANACPGPLVCPELGEGPILNPYTNARHGVPIALWNYIGVFLFFFPWILYILALIVGVAGVGTLAEWLRSNTPIEEIFMIFGTVLVLYGTWPMLLAIIFVIIGTYLFATHMGRILQSARRSLRDQN